MYNEVCCIVDLSDISNNRDLKKGLGRLRVRDFLTLSNARAWTNVILAEKLVVAALSENVGLYSEINRDFKI